MSCFLGLYIQNIAVKGPAYLDGKLKLYDQIMSVNSKPITGETYKDVLNSLQTSQEIEMIVKTSCHLEDGVFRMETPVIIKRRIAKSEEEFEIRMKRETSGDFGFSIEDTYDTNGEMCVTICEITNRDIAGMLEPGDRILEVNSVRLVSLKSAQINTLMEAFTDIHIRLQRDSLSSEKQIAQQQEPVSQLTRDSENYPDVTPNTPPPAVPPTTPEKFMDPDYIEFETEITKLHNSLGLNVNILIQQSEVSVYVTEVVVGSSADRTGVIRPGDQIVSIDYHELTGLEVKEPESFLRSLPNGKTFLVKLRRESRSPVTSEGSEQRTPHTPATEAEPEASQTGFIPSPRPDSLSLEQTTTVMILKDSTGALGIRLHHVNEKDDTVGIYIKDILKGSPASKAAELHPGAKLVAINNQSLVGVDRQKAVSMLKKATNPILLDIIPDPLMVASELSLSGSPRFGLIPPLTHVDTKSTLSHESLPGRSISTQELMAVLDSPDVREEHFSVTLQRGEKGLGLKVISKQVDQTGLLVKSIIGDPALSDGQLTRGDEITAIDGIDIQNMIREEVFPLIKGEVNSVIKLDVKRYIRLESTDSRPEEGIEELDSSEYLPASLLFSQLSTNSYSRPLPEHSCIEHVFELKLSRGSKEKLGIHIGYSPTDQFPTGIFVKNLTEDSVASLDGRLSVDDILLEANGIDLRSLDKEAALEAIKQSGSEIKFLVARYTPYNTSVEVGDEQEVPGPPPPDSAPPPIPLLNQLNTPLFAEQAPSADTNTDTIVITHSLDDMIKSLESMEQQVLHPSIPSKDTYPKHNIPPNLFLMHKAVQDSAVRIVGPFTQLDFGTYSLEDLQVEIKRIHDEMDPDSVENDFKEMRARKPDIPSSVAKADHNIKKNRSLRAIPYDTNRIVLNSTDPVEDYLNASLVQIKVNELEFKFVCTQAPLPSEVGRFWQMVWEQELYVIVMLVELKEFGIKRTPPYWDESDNQDLKEEDKMDFGNFKVMMVEERCRERMNLRGIYLTNKSTGESRHIMQFNYKQWSGNGFPKSVVDFCNFIDFIRERVGAKEILVHCNNGIGRTGSYCLVDMLSILVKNRVKADLFQLVLTLNSSRMNLIQTSEQYKFGYSALVHLLFERSH